MRFDILKKRIEAIEAATFRQSIVLKDGSKWVPKVPLLDMFLEYLERECTGSHEDLSTELVEELTHWAKYEPRPGEGIIPPSLVGWAKEVLHVD
jgi:hypothetical protein